MNGSLPPVRLTRVTGEINATDFEAAAQKAKLTGQVRSFLDWLGEGRKLTQTGRMGMADARYLGSATCSRERTGSTTSTTSAMAGTTP